ncbi:hypothetical protein DNK65_04550 [Citrobacter koseri]|uniref:hypothetical protein n=1 Tax=Citrobacter koseri TaxID=545 RepID=UPI000D7C89F6|nr:hypothetical protein DNK65_04550 [Citrobacter koseri]
MPDGGARALSGLRYGAVCRPDKRSAIRQRCCAVCRPDKRSAIRQRCCTVCRPDKRKRHQAKVLRGR